LAYAFSLAGNQDKRKEIMKSLDEEAVKEGESTPELFLLSHILCIENCNVKLPYSFLL
jgi:hypothetical protein